MFSLIRAWVLIECTIRHANFDSHYAEVGLGLNRL